MRNPRGFASTALAVLFGLLVPIGIQAGELASRLKALREARLDPPGAVGVFARTFEFGPVRVHLERGTLVPVVSSKGEPTGEWLFSGAGRLQVEPPDAVEASQLELFADQDRLDEPFARALFMLPGPIVASPEAAAEVPPDLASVLADWLRAGERRALGIETSQLRASLGDAGIRGLAIARVDTATLGQILAIVDPESPEPVTLGRFEKPELSAGETRYLTKVLHREQRRGWLTGLEVSELGQWDTWISAVGAVSPGRPSFEARHHQLRVRISGSDLRLEQQIRLETMTPGAHLVSLVVPTRSTISRVRSAGRDLDHLLLNRTLLVVLPHSPAVGDALEVELELVHEPFERDKYYQGITNRFLQDGTGWYAYTGIEGRATFDLDVSYPKGWGELVAPGRRIHSEPGRGHFVLETPTFGTTFEIGEFDRMSKLDSRIPIEIYYDRNSSRLDRISDRFPTLLAQSLAYFEERFGPVQDDSLRLVLSPRDYSQAFRGFLVVSVWDVAAFDHEIAHLWWAHEVQFRSYRDQWWSEAVASWCQLTSARARALDTGRPGRRFNPAVSSWPLALGQELDDGRRLEGLGPLILGQRLDSSRGDGYAAIVYLKGPLVLEAMAQRFGEDALYAALRFALERHRGGTMTTGEFQQALTDRLGPQVTTLFEHFVYAVGLPEYTYDVQWQKLADGRYEITGTIRRDPAVRYRYQIVADPNGNLLDVQRLPDSAAAPLQPVLTVPVEIGVHDPELLASLPREYRKKAREEGARVISARLVLREDETGFKLTVDQEPKDFWIDRHGEFPGYFFETEPESRQSRLVIAHKHLAAGRSSEARRAFESYFAAPAPILDARTSYFSFDNVRRGTWKNDELAHLGLARLALDDGDLETASHHLDRAGDLNVLSLFRPNELERRRLEARLALRRGRPQAAWSLLDIDHFRHSPESRERLALRLLAAWALKDAPELARLQREAQSKGIDLGPLAPGGAQ